MAFIKYVDSENIRTADRVPTDDNVLRVHGIHSRVMKLHYDLYFELMHSPGVLSRLQRELIATLVSTINACHY